MNIVKYTLATAVVLGVTVSPALAQDVSVRVKVDTRVVREVIQDVQEAVQAAVQDAREAVHDALGPDFRHDLHSAVHDMAEAFEGLGGLAWDSDWGQSLRFRATQTDRETRRFTVGASGQLDLETLSGDITIRSSSGREVVVELVRTARGVDDAAAKTGLSRVNVESEERGGRVTIRTVYPNERQRDYSVSVDYIVTAPAGTRISTRSISGDVSVKGINGELSIDTTSGDVDVTDALLLTSAKTVSGDLTLTNVGAEGLLEGATMSGDIVASGIKARRVELGTISGGVTAKGVSAGDVTLKSMSDDVVFDGELTPRGRYEFSSHSGDVRITLAGRVGFSFDASTFSGSVRNNAGIEVSTTGRTGTRRGMGSSEAAKRMQGTFGDGSAIVSATSFSGDVVVTRK